MKKKVNFIITTVYITLVMLSIYSCASLQVQDQNSFKKIKQMAIKGDPKAWAALDKAIETPPAKQPQLANTILEHLGEMPQPQAEKILQKYLRSSDEKKRSMAFYAYGKRASFTPQDDIYKNLLSAMRDNLSRYQKWLPVEQSLLLAKETSPQTRIDFLNSLLNSKVPPFSKHKDLFLQIATQALRKSNTPPDMLGEDEKFLLQNAYSSFKQQNFAESKKILDEISLAYNLQARAHFLWMWKNQTQEKEMLGQYMKENHPAWLAELSPRQKPEPAETKTQTQNKKIAPPNIVPAAFKNSSRDALLQLAEKYQLQKSDMSAMENRIAQHVISKNGNAEKRYLFTAMREAYPQKSFFDYQSMLDKSFEHDKFFASLMHTIEKENSDNSMRILILRQISGLSYAKAQNLWQMYRKNF